MRRRATSGLSVFAAAVCLLVLPRLSAAAPDVALAMGLSPEVPAPGQTVEITITARNAGTSDAIGVVVTNTLPSGLAPAPGQAPFPGTGWYEPATGRWFIDTLGGGASTVLVLPVVVAAGTQPPCLVDVARSSVAGDAEAGNDRAVAAVKRTGSERCVDLRFESPRLQQSGCGGAVFVYYAATLVNEGPDDAHDVLVDFSQTPPVLPGVAFFGEECVGTRCVIPVLAARTRRELEAGSSRFDDATPGVVGITLAASSGDAEYAGDDNQRTDEFRIDESPGCGDVGGIGLSGCFIATAAYGSPLEAHVQVLRDFRDRRMRRSAPGRVLIAFYDRYSPPAAAVIARHASLRFVTRALLTPVVLAIEFPVAATTAILVLCGALIGRRRVVRRRARSVRA